MTSFAYPPMMAAHSFDPYATHETTYSEFPTTTQSYPTSGAYVDTSYSSAALSSIDSFAAMNAFTEMPRMQDSYNFNHSQHNYSPITAEAEHMLPPTLSASSDSGASAHSTVSSAIGSPHLHAQYQHPEPWNALPTSQGLGLAQDMSSQEIFARDTYFTSSMDQESVMATDKMPGFVGESIASLPRTSRSGVSFPHSLSTIASNSPFSPSHLHIDRSRQLPSPPILKSQTSSPFSNGNYFPPPRLNDGFKSPGIPASARYGEFSGSRRNSLLSNQIYPPPTTPPMEPMNGMLAASPESIPSPFPSHSTRSFSSPLRSSCRFPAPFSAISISLKEDSLMRYSSDPLSLSPFSASLSFQYPDPTAALSPRLFEQQPPSPAPSHASARSHTGKIKPSPHQSPYLGTAQYHPYAYPTGRRPSTSSVHSRHSHASQRSGSFELSQEDQDKGVCPIPDCGRSFKDLKAHMLTHQTERPEKCPIQTCEYHIKGFARKYDKNRHTLTHYKGTMVCGFCPGSGSAAEKSFNRADVFKRHLTSVHGVEQTPPNARRKSPISGKKGFSSAAQNTSAGTCSTCSVTFANAQEFYEHLDDCVLRVVQQIDPAEGINQKNLASIADDADVKETLEAHGLSGTEEYGTTSYDDVEEEEEEFVDNDDAADATYGSRNPRSGKGTIKASKKNGAVHGGGNSTSTTLHNNTNRITKISGGRRVGLTFSKGGVDHARQASGNGRKKRKNYPTSWGCHAEKMKMKKRVLCVYDGPRRLWKDDMMLDSQFEVRMRLPGGDGKAYVTDLDVQMLKRAEALHGATTEERGPWIPDNVFNPDVDELRL